MALGNESAITGCAYGNNQDYWAAAMKYCKDKGYHLLTSGEWSKIYQALFGYEGWGGCERLNQNLASDLGLSFQCGITRGYCVWLSKETAADKATTLGISMSTAGHTSKSNACDPFKSRNYMVICVEK